MIGAATGGEVRSVVGEGSSRQSCLPFRQSCSSDLRASIVNHPPVSQSLEQNIRLTLQRIWWSIDNIIRQTLKKSVQLGLIITRPPWKRWLRIDKLRALAYEISFVQFVTIKNGSRSGQQKHSKSCRSRPRRKGNFW